MSIETWGLMPKSQVDDETIEEAIERLIAVHEHSPDSHMGENEAIEAHRKSEIIDHLAGSVVSDKLTNQDYEWKFSFESLDGFDDSVNVDLPEAGTMRLITTYNTTDYADMTTSFLMPAHVFDELKNMTVSFGARFNNTITGVSGNLRFYLFSFQIQNGVLKARYPFNSATNEIDLSSYDITEEHFYKIVYTAFTRTADFYIDGELVGSITKASGAYLTSNLGPGFDITEPSSGSCFLYITNLFFSRQA